MGHFYEQDAVDRALAMIAAGNSISSVSRQLDVPRWTVQRWKTMYVDRGLARGQGHCQVPCPRCTGRPLDEEAYSELLGWYLGDGHIVKVRTVFALRIYNDAQYTSDNARLLDILRRVKPGSRPTAHGRDRLVICTLYWKHWSCLFPQHGPGRKHNRPIVLEEWQQAIVRRHPGSFLRGLFHSDGARVKNWAQRLVAGEMKRYEYPRWQFSNRSADIRALCCWALDLAEIPWRQSQAWTISVSRREAVSRLDALIGLKQ